jgi:hypothetical protein
MRKRFFILFGGILMAFVTRAQEGEAANYANSAFSSSGAALASKAGSDDVNLFTGQPNVSVPIYNYKSNNGLRLSVSIDYAGGSGIRLHEQASILGIGWYLNAGGVITRSVRGMPDDMKDIGFMYADSIPTDFRTDDNKYYHDSLDSQQDVFQFNLPGQSGRFLIGKNGQIALIPLSKIKVIPGFTDYGSGNRTLTSFRIITEDGIKYDFEDGEYMSQALSTTYGGLATRSGYENRPYGTAWYLTRITPAFSSNDFILLEYSSESTEGGGQVPQMTFVNNANGARKTPYSNSFHTYETSQRINRIRFPDSTKIDFVYKLSNHLRQWP